MAQPLRLMAGLGNPGAGYHPTRHNVGFWLADRLAEREGASWKAEKRFHGELARLRLPDGELLLLKPMTFMNRSGQAIRTVADFYKIPASEILVAHDELDLPAGTARLKRGGGHGGHNGLRDVHRHLGTPDYLRLRIGIGHPGQAREVIDYVLSKPTRDEAEAIDGALTRTVEALEILMREGWDRACTRLHTDPTRV